MKGPCNACRHREAVKERHIEFRNDMRQQQKLENGNQGIYGQRTTQKLAYARPSIQY